MRCVTNSYYAYNLILIEISLTQNVIGWPTQSRTNRLLRFLRLLFSYLLHWPGVARLMSPSMRDLAEQKK